MQTLRGQIDDQQGRLAATTAELARVQAERDTATHQAQAAAAERDVLRANADTALRELQFAHARELESRQAARTEHDAAIRAEVDQATARLEGVQKRVMLQADEAREAQRRAEAALSKTQQRNEQLVADVQRCSADAAEQRRLAERHETQLVSVLDELRELRRERDALTRQVAQLQGQLQAQGAPAPARPMKRTR